MPPPPPPPKSIKDDSEPEVLGERTARGCRLMGLAELARDVDGEARSCTRFTGLTEPAREGGRERVPGSAPGKHCSGDARRHRQADRQVISDEAKQAGRQTGHQRETGKTDRPSAMKRARSRVPCAHARPAHTTLNHTRPRRHQSRPSRQTGPPRRHPPGPGGCRPEATSSADAGTRAGHALTCTGRDFGHASRAYVVRARPTWLRRPAAAPPQVLHVCPPASAGAPPAPGQSLRVHAKNDSRGSRRDTCRPQQRRRHGGAEARGRAGWCCSGRC